MSYGVELEPAVPQNLRPWTHLATDSDSEHRIPLTTVTRHPVPLALTYPSISFVGAQEVRRKPICRFYPRLITPSDPGVEEHYLDKYI